MKQLINKLAKWTLELVSWAFIGTLMMILVETVLFVDGVAKYTDIMVWCVIAIVVYEWLNIWRDK